MDEAQTAAASTQRIAVARMVLRAVMLPGAFLLAATFILLGEVRYLVHSLQWVEQTQEVTSNIEDLQRLFIDMETGLRAYAATGDAELLQPYTESHNEVQARFSQIAERVSDSPRQSERIARLHAMFISWTQYAVPILERARAGDGGLKEAELEHQMVAGKRLMDEIRAQVREISAAESRLQDLRLRQARRTEFAVLGTTTLLAITGGAILGFRTRREIHEIVQAHALRATNALLETLVKDAPAGLVMFDRNMRYIRASERWIEEVGLKGRFVVGRSHYEDFPDLSPRLIAAHRRGLAGESVSGNGEWINAAGEYHTGHWAIQPYGEPGTPASGIIMFTEDTTERKRNEDALRESEERFRTLVQHASDAFFLHDTEGRIIDVNQQACESLGYTREELLQMKVSDVEENFNLEPAQESWRQMQATGPLTLIGHHRRKDGSRFPYEARLSTYNVGDRQFILRLVRDTSERTQFEMQLRENEATIRTLLDTASQAILAVDADGAIVLANRMVGQMFQYTPNELQGKPLEVLLPERLREHHRIYRAQFNAHPTPRVMGIGLELLGVRRDGTEFPIEVSLSSVSTKQGLLAVSFVSDITARKHAEQAQRESEQKLRLLAGSLLTAQEDERRSLARELHDDITQQLAFLSIELGKLGGDVLDSGTRARLHDLHGQALRASSEVRRLSHGLHPSVITDFGLSVALEEFCEDFERVHGVSVEFEELVEDAKLTDSQATCLYRVAQESMRNAITHGSASEIRVSLMLDVDGTVRLKVADNGGGFEPDQVKGKAGLGITSMTERVRLSGGGLSIVSSRGQGTEITASLPLRGANDESYENHSG